jgi:endonuclease/exonuclease/phosphatase (EEP) superfamily protein YafD
MLSAAQCDAALYPNAMISPDECAGTLLSCSSCLVRQLCSQRVTEFLLLFFILLGLTALLVVATLLPLWRYEAWWVRDLDFPRLQFAFLALGLIVATVFLLDLSRPAVWILLGTLLACLAYHAWWILPYTRLHRPEVASADRSAPESRIRILAVNVLMPNRNADALLRIIGEQDPDVVVAVETNKWWEDQLKPLDSEYPHALKCPLDNLYGMHLYSRFPLEDSKIQFLVESDIPSMHTLVVLPSGARIQLHCLHPAPPSPTENPESTERDAELIVVGKNVAEARLPVVVTGDLNDVAWSETTRLFRKISGLLDPRVGRGMFNTFHARYPFVRWPLDHLFHSRHFRLSQIQRLAAFGSDHFPILVELQLSGAGGNGPALRADREDIDWAEEKTAEVRERRVHTPGE